MQEDSSRLDWFSALLAKVAYRTASYPVWTLAVTAAISLLAVGLATTRLEFHTSRLALLSPKAGYNQRWLAFLNRFGREDDAVVVVSHSDPERVAAALTTVGIRLSADPELSGVLYRQSLGQVSNKALYLLPAERLTELLQLLQGCSMLISSRTSEPAVTAASHLESSSAAGLNALQSFLSAIGQTQSGLTELAQSTAAEGPLLLEDDGTLGLCLVRMPHMDDQPERAARVIKLLNEHLQVLQPHYPEVQFGLTGMPVLEWDESQSSQRDMQNATLLSLGGVALIFVFGFGSWRMPCAAVVCLTIGLLWTVGLATIFVGHLNLFSVAFGAIIAGLGIDYAIHLLSRLRTNDDMERHVDQLPRALADAVGYCGKGIVTGAVTTAAAFAVAVLTPFKGMTELGVICALGTLTCLTVTLVVLPAFIVLQAKYLPTFEPAPWKSWLGIWHEHFMRALSWSNRENLRHRKAILIGVAAVTLLAASQVPRLHYDHNLLNLQAHDAPSVQAEHELTSRTQHSAWFAVSMAKSPAAARKLHERFMTLPSVARVDEIGGALSQSRDARTAQLVTACRNEAEKLADCLDHSFGTVLAAGQDTRDASIIPANYQHFNYQQAGHQLALSMDAQFASQLKELTRSITAMASVQPPMLGDFPEAVRTRMSSVDGKTYLLRVFAKQNLWDRENLKQFVKELESVDPRITGHPIQTWYASGELENSYYQAGIYATLTVCALLMLDLQSIRLVLLSLIPVAISFVQLCGCLVLLGIPFNAANMIVLPLIIGIGIDDGVHIMHDFSHRGSRRFELSGSTTLAVLLTSLTTMVGFGCMGIADHRGLQSLGIVLLTGVGLCLIHSWFTLPAILSFFSVQTVSHPGTEWTSNGETSHNAEAKAVKGLSTESDHQPLLLTNVPVVLSLPEYPELYLKS